jgi:hypothetical protein
VASQPPATDLPALAQAGAALQAMMHGAFRHLHVFREVVLDQLMENYSQSQLVGQTMRDLPAAGTHFSRHR